MRRQKPKPRPLGYYGGKSGYGKARWINSFLPPPSSEQLFIELFGGMAGVLLDREPAGNEIFNDLNRRVANYWRVVRDMPAEFGWLVEHTPVCQDFYEESIEQIDDMALPDIRRALAFHTIIVNCINSGDNSATLGSFRVQKTPGRPKVRRWFRGDISLLADRMRYVQVLHMPAMKLLEDFADCAAAVIYADPPYHTANTSAYTQGDIDKDELTEALLAQKGFVAISGYGGEWDHLGWRRESRSALRRQIDANPSEPRVERLWLNQDPPHHLL